MATIIPGYADFELDLVSALKENLPPVFNGIAPVSLVRTNVDCLPSGAQGVYMLLEKNAPVYFGKTDATHGFKDRLTRHAESIQQRKFLNPADISFKCVRIMVFTVISVESAMIKTFGADAGLSWQNWGFGSNDPGHNRENQKASVFDKKYPVDIDIPMPTVVAGTYNAAALLSKLKDELPYVFRYDTSTAQNELDLNIALPDAPSMRDILQTLVRAVPGWVATHFPGRVILYPEPTGYPEALTKIS
jgi:hypothetical protein